MIIGESKQLRLMAKILAWSRPPEVERHLSLDTEPGIILVFLSLAGISITIRLPESATAQEIDTKLNLGLHRVSHAYDCALRAPLDIGPFEPILTTPIDCGG
jgi:hypothetical protein